ncbi:MAG: trehalose-6-phosphate synthase [Acidobacteria bacterium]|nr:MAG: trehalose-6-phosphate synthase [Acidobacteriota bacterium]
MRLSVRLNFSLIIGVTLVSLALALYQAQSETRGLKRDLERHSFELAETLEKSASPLVANHAAVELQRLVDHFQNRQRVAGVAVYDDRGNALAITSDLATRLGSNTPPVAQAALRENGAGKFFRLGEQRMHVFELPIKAGATVIGALAIFHDVAYISARQAATWKHALAGLAVQTALIVCVTLLILRWSLGEPLARLTQWLHEVRTGSASGGPELPEEETFQPLKREVARLATTLTAARAAAEEEARLRNAAEALWTPERLRIFVQEKLGSSRLFAISNREPYEHLRRGNTVECSVPASGLVTALEPILRACDGTWIAQGTGDADHETVDQHDRLRVPPDHPQYTLRRVWITPEEEQGFYFGFANEGLWPLCHIAHTRPTFRAQDWEHYRVVNRRFADALLEEAAGEENPLVLVQDYHFALVPAMIKEARPDARVAIFWHIPWPNPEAFAICPCQRQLLDGLLGADLIGFHIQSHCNNFLETVERTLESRIDRERFAVNRRGHFTSVRPFPISVTFSNEPGDAAPRESTWLERATLFRELGVEASMLGVGVDRIDYTKGIPERFRAIERFFEKYPIYKRQFTFVQIGAPSRTHITRYQDLLEKVSEEAQRINRRFETSSWQPIVFLPYHHSHKQILPYYRTADLCMVTSLHDGMNLVAKEYVAARSDEQGALILSHFTGASHELVDALLVNPYDTEELADAIHSALEMAPDEKRARMARMRAYLREHNIYRWAGSLIAELAALRIDAGERRKRPQPDSTEVESFAAAR